MSITLELTEEQERVLAQCAKRAGLDVPTFVVAVALNEVKRETNTPSFLEQEARQAVASAQKKLLEHGIAYVTGDENSTVKHAPPPPETK